MTVWAVPAYLDYVQVPLTPAAIDEFEQQRGVRLPAAYLAVLEEQNGGYVRARWPDLPHRRIDGIGSKFPNIGQVTWWQDDVEDGQWVPGHPELLVAFDGDGHWDLCFDYRNRGPAEEPQIALIDNEVGKDVPVASSFDGFLDGLVNNLERDALRIVADVDLESFAHRLAAACAGSVEDQGSWNHGYQTFRVVLAGGGSAWVSPNRVPAGFRRDGREIEVTAAMGLRLPEHPECTVLVTHTDEAAAATRAAVESTGMGQRA